MSVDTNTYGTVAAIERLIGDVVASRTFSGSTFPSTTQVEAELDAVAAEINAHLDAHGYTAKISSSSWPFAYNAAAAANNYGAAARLLAVIPSMAYDTEEDRATSRQGMYEGRFRAFLKKIAERQIRAGMRRTHFDNLIAGARLNDDGDTNVPLFTRDTSDYPGSRSLVE